MTDELFPRKDHLEKIRYLWKLDDKEWMRERKEQWRFLVEGNLNDFSAKEKKQLKDLFVNAKKDRYISGPVAYLFTPYCSPETASEAFWSDLLGSQTERMMTLSSYLGTATEYGQGLPWLRQHLRDFVEGVLGHQHRMIEAEIGGGDKKDISPEPTKWCFSFTKNVTDLLTGVNDYHGCVEAVDYFVSALRYATKEMYRELIDLEGFLSLVDKSIEESSASDLALKTARKVKAESQRIRENWAMNAHLDTGN